MKKYVKPALLNNAEFSYKQENIFPSVGAITGAMSMLARSAAKVDTNEKRLLSLQSLRVRNA